MNKQILIGILSILTVSSILPVTFGSTGNYIFQWQMCTHTYIEGSFEIQSNVGSPYVVISWSVPTNSFEYTVFGCTKVPLSAVEMSTYVNLGSPYQPLTTSRVSSSSQNSVSLEIQVKHCVYTGKINYCSPPEAYPIKYGNSIVVALYAIYGNTVSHGLTETLTVTS